MSRRWHLSKVATYMTSYPHVAMPEGILTWGYDSPILFEDVLQDSATPPKTRHQRRSTSRASL